MYIYIYIYIYIYSHFNVIKHKIIELEDPTADADAVNSRTLNRNITKPSNHTIRFAYLMAPTTGLQQWTNLIGDS